MIKKTYSSRGHLTLESMSKASWYNNWTIMRFKKHLRGEILEVGCGIGSFTKILLKYGRVHAFDIDPTGVKKTKSDVKGAKVGFGDIEAGVYFFNKQSFSTNKQSFSTNNLKFDTITCINVLEHIKDDNKALENINNLLNSNGTLILLVPAHPALFGEIDRAIGHHRRYKKNQVVKRLEKLNLEILFAKKMNFLGALGWFMAGKVLKEVSVNEKRLKLFDKVAPFILPLEKVIEPPFGTSLLIIARKSS